MDTVLCVTLLSKIDEQIEALVGPGAVDRLDFEAVEVAARRQALRVAARALEQRLNADTSDQTGPSVACACGQPARYAGRRAKAACVAVMRPSSTRRTSNFSGGGLRNWAATSGLEIFAWSKRGGCSWPFASNAMPLTR